MTYFAVFYFFWKNGEGIPAYFLYAALADFLIALPVTINFWSALAARVLH